METTVLFGRAISFRQMPFAVLSDVFWNRCIRACTLWHVVTYLLFCPDYNLIMSLYSHRSMSQSQSNQWQRILASTIWWWKKGCDRASHPRGMNKTRSTRQGWVQKLLIIRLARVNAPSDLAPIIYLLSNRLSTEIRDLKFLGRERVRDWPPVFSETLLC